MKKLEKEESLCLSRLGNGKTSAQTVRLNWDNELAEKTLPFSWSRRHCSTKRWRFNFAELKQEVDFLILYGSILHSPKKEQGTLISEWAPNEKSWLNFSDKILKRRETQAKKFIP